MSDRQSEDFQRRQREVGRLRSRLRRVGAEGNKVMLLVTGLVRNAAEIHGLRNTRRLNADRIPMAGRASPVALAAVVGVGLMTAKAKEDRSYLGIA